MYSDSLVIPFTFSCVRSKGVAMHKYGISVYYVYTGSQLMDMGGVVQNEREDQARVEF